MARVVTLIVEDGTIVTDANSFVTEEQIVAYAAARGVTIANGTDAEKDLVAILGLRAMDYLMIMPWRGETVELDQRVPWPRKNMSTTPSFPENQIPISVIEAQLQLTLLANGGTILVPTSAGTGFLIKEEIGPIKNTYSEKVGISKNGLPLLPGIDALLDRWLLGDIDGFVPVMLLSVGGFRGC